MERAFFPHFVRDMGTNSHYAVLEEIGSAEVAIDKELARDALQLPVEILEAASDRAIARAVMEAARCKRQDIYPVIIRPDLTWAAWMVKREYLSELLTRDLAEVA
jgi:hypothetical protein